MKKLRLDFKNRIVSIVTDQKTVVAFMEDDLNKKDFLVFFPKEAAEECSDNVTFDFEKKVICIKQPVRPAQNLDTHVGRYKCVKRIPVPTIAELKDEILNTIGWQE